MKIVTKIKLATFYRFQRAHTFAAAERNTAFGRNDLLDRLHVCTQETLNRTIGRTSPCSSRRKRVEVGGEMKDCWAFRS